MKRAPTKRAAVVLGVGCLLVLAGATAQAGWLFVLAAGVLGLAVGSLIVRHRLATVEISRSVPRRARVGDDVRAGITVFNPTTRGIPLFVIEDGYPAFAPVRVAVEGLDAGATAEIELVRRAATRGIFDQGTVTLSSGSPFGLARSRRQRTMASELTVVPRWAELNSFPILEPSSSPSDVLHERARTGAGQEYLGVREYRAGDPLRSVHWRSTARAGRLIVREYEQEIATRLGLVIAGADHGDGATSAFESLVSAVATIGIYALSTGHPIYLTRAGTDGIEHLAEPGKHDLLDWLATAQPSDTELGPLVDELVARIGRRGTIVVCAASSGLTGRSIGSAIRHIQSAGARAILVVARASTWGSADADETATGGEVGGGRAPIRVLRAGEEVGECLAG